MYARTHQDDEDTLPLNEQQLGADSQTTSSRTTFKKTCAYWSFRNRLFLCGLVTVVIVALVVFSWYFFLRQPSGGQREVDFQNLINDYWNQVLKFDPLTATFVGNTDYNDVFPILTKESFAEQLAYFTSLQSKVLAYSGFSFSTPSLKLSYEIMVEELKYRIANLQFQPYLIPLSQLNQSPQITLPQLVGATPFTKEDDYVKYVKRLKLMPSYIQNTSTLILASEAMNITLPQVIVAIIPDQIQALITAPNQSLFYAPFITRNISDTLSAEALQVITNDVLPAFATFKTFVESYVTRCRTTIGASALPNGKKFYEAMANYYTTTTKTPEEIHNIGLEQVKSIITAMTVISTKYNYSDLQQFINFLRTDPQFYAKSKDEYLDYTRALCKKADEKLPMLFSFFPRCPYGVRAIPANEEMASASAYYTAPDGACTRAGIYYTNTYNISQRPLYSQPSTSLHEAVPGHHMQIAIQQELDLPAFRKFGGWNAYIEGWALYAEYLGNFMGIFDDDYKLFGHYSDGILRAVRLVVDTGMHYLNMSRQDAIEYALANTALSSKDIVSEIDRYISWPGQALGYKIGELKIQEIRAQLAAALPTFDVREFHNVVLRDGALPLTTLENNVKSYYCTNHKVLC